MEDFEGEAALICAAAFFIIGVVALFAKLYLITTLGFAAAVFTAIRVGYFGPRRGIIQ